MTNNNVQRFFNNRFISQLMGVAAIAMGALFIFVGSAQAAPTGKDIMKKVYAESKKHDTQQSDVYMVILDKKGSKRTRFFKNTRFNKGSDISKTLIKFYRPPNVNGTGLLTHADDKKEDNEQWVYFPAFKSVTKISTENKNDSFMGSDYTYADIGGRNLNQDKHKLLKTTKKYFVVRSTPKKSSDQYSKIEFVINKKVYVPARVVFYDKKGKKLKTLTNKKIRKIKGMYTVVNSVMKNHQTKGSSSLEVSKIKVGIDIGENDVGILALKN